LQTIQFMKNLAIAGGLFALLAFGGGAWSVDGWIGRKRQEVEAGGGATAAKPRVPVKPTTQAA
jgi:putative oxidoreductase